MQRVHFREKVPRLRHIPAGSASELGEEAHSKIDVVTLPFVFEAMVLRCRQVDAAEVDRGGDVVGGDKERLLEALKRALVIVESEMIQSEL